MPANSTTIYHAVYILIVIMHFTKWMYKSHNIINHKIILFKKQLWLQIIALQIIDVYCITMLCQSLCTIKGDTYIHTCYFNFEVLLNIFAIHWEMEISICVFIATLHLSYSALNTIQWKMKMLWNYEQLISQTAISKKI